MRLFCLFLKIAFILIFKINICYSQNQLLIIKGNITDSLDNPIISSFVKVTNDKNLILAYWNTGNTNSFELKLNPPYPDSVDIIFSNFTYHTQTINVRIKSSDTILYINPKLKLKINELSEVKVTAPPVWVRGDTTFYSANYFKEGNEKKLKDLLEKIPDFEFNKGMLYYKKLLIEKVTLDGEELFSDKINLIIENLPVHVLETIQAIENQSSNKKLNGLDNSKKVFLNIGLNKAKLQFAFGDVELGAGTNKRYSISPVLFSLYGKFKLGFIGNTNSVGKSVSTAQFNEVKNEFEAQNSSQLMNNYLLRLINNLDNKWYIKNRLFDNRFQLNTPISKKIKSKTEFNQISDRQAQNVFENSLLLNNNQFQQRLDTNNNAYKPSIWQITQNINWDINAKSEIKLVGNVYLDNSSGKQIANYTGFGINDGTTSQINNKWASYSLNLEYLKRISDNSATTLNLKINQQKINQFGLGNSNDIDRLFNTNQAGYNQLNNNLDNEYTGFILSAKNLKRTKKNKIVNYGLSASADYLSLNNNVFVEGNNINQETIYNTDFEFNNIAIKGNYSRNLDLFTIKKINFRSEFGFSRFKTDSITLGNKLKPIIKISFDKEYRLFKVFNVRNDFSYSENLSNYENYNTNLYTNGLYNFKNANLNNQNLKNISLSHAMAYRLPQDLTSISFAVFYRSNLNTLASSSNFNGFLNYATDTLIKKPSQSLTFSLSGQIPSVYLNTLIYFRLSHSINNRFALVQNQLLKTNFNFNSYNLILKKNWNKKFFIINDNSFSTFTLSYAESLANQIENNVKSLRSNLNLRYVMNPQLTFSSSVNHFNNNIGTPNQFDFTLTDFRTEFKLKKKAIFFNLEINNLLNEKSYKDFYIGPISQSFTSLPLVNRNIYLSVKSTF